MRGNRPRGDKFDDLPGAIGQPLMPALLPLVIALKRAQNYKERQSPNAARPGDLDQEHRTQLAESVALTKCDCEERTGSR
jgi:hypothetical protein